MEEKIYLQKLLEMKSGYEVDIYRDINFKNEHLSFEGTPKKHPYDSSYLVLLSDPFAKNNHFYEFSLNSIGTIEDMGTITSEDGKSANRVRVWVRKGMTALRTEPFTVK